MGGDRDLRSRCAPLRERASRRRRRTARRTKARDESKGERQHVREIQLSPKRNAKSKSRRTEQGRASKKFTFHKASIENLIENLPEAICVIDDPGYCVLVNDAMCRLVGVSRAGLVGAHYGTYVDRETRAMMETNWAQRERGGPAPFSYECKGLRPDGNVRTTQVVPVMLRPSSGSPLRLVIVKDVTDYRRMQDQLDGVGSPFTPAANEVFALLPPRMLDKKSPSHAGALPSTGSAIGRDPSALKAPPLATDLRPWARTFHHISHLSPHD